VLGVCGVLGLCVVVLGVCGEVLGGCDGVVCANAAILKAITAATQKPPEYIDFIGSPP
jgi:hypothetical protein